MFREPGGYVRSSYPSFPHPMPAGGMYFNDPTFVTEVTAMAIQHLQMYGLSGLKSPAGGSEPSHDEIHVLRAFEDEKFVGGASVGTVFRLHLGVSLSSKALKTLRTPYIDMDGNEQALGFVPYTNLDQRTLTAYGIRSDHFWNEIIFYPDVEVDLITLRFHCRKNAGITNDTTRSTINTSISAANHGDFDPEATKNRNRRTTRSRALVAIARGSQGLACSGEDPHGAARRSGHQEHETEGLHGVRPEADRAKRR